MEQKSNVANKKTSDFAYNWLTAKINTHKNYLIICQVISLVLWSGIGVFWSLNVHEQAIFSNQVDMSMRQYISRSSSVYIMCRLFKTHCSSCIRQTTTNCLFALSGFHEKNQEGW